MKKKSPSFWVSLLAILVSSACVLTVPVPSLAPEPAPAAPELASTQATETQAPAPLIEATASATPLPTWTASATLTFFPTITRIPTDTLTPSITPSVLPVILTLGANLPPETLTAVAGDPVASGDPIGSNFSCIFLSKKYDDLTVRPPKYQFTMWWELQNAGKKSWKEGDVVLSFVEGTKLSRDRTAPIPFDVSPGQTVRVQVEMETPKSPGTYSMTWGLKDERANRNFCFFTFTVVVSK